VPLSDEVIKQLNNLGGGFPPEEEFALGDFLNALTPGGSTSDPVYDCSSSVGTGDVVYFSADNFVSKALAGGGGKTDPAIAIVRGKLSSTQAIVAQIGEVGGFSGLVHGKKYFVSATTPGVITDVSPDATGEFSQQVGIAASPNVLLVNIYQAVEL
jgi:hypothetical protein